MYNIFINSDYLDKIMYGRTAKEYCKQFDFDYKLFKKIYNSDLSVTLRDLIRFAITFNIDMQALLII